MRTQIFACLLALASIVPASAQQDDRYPSSGGSPSGGGAAPGGTIPGLGATIDDTVAGLAERKQGFIAIDAIVSGTGCGSTRIVLGRRVEGQVQQVGSLPAGGYVFGQKLHGGGAVLNPGEYVVTHVICSSMGRQFFVVGPFARFHVNAGEVVNVGMLFVQVTRDSGFVYKITGRSVGGMRPQTRAVFRERHPKTAARMIDRYMTLMAATGPARPGIGTGAANVGGPPAGGADMR